MACTKIYRLAFEIYQNVLPEETVHAKAQRSAKTQRRVKDSDAPASFDPPLRLCGPLRLCVKC